MSAVARVAVSTAARSAPVPRTGYLRLVPQRRGRARRAPFVAVVVALLAGGLLGLLALNTVLAQDAFALHELQVQGKELADREQALLTSLEALQAPRALAERAESLGMVPAGPPAFLRLPDGAALGQSLAAQAPTSEQRDDIAVPPVPSTVDQTGSTPQGGIGAQSATQSRTPTVDGSDTDTGSPPDPRDATQDAQDRQNETTTAPDDEVTR